jgi:hypothetical protein
MEDAFAAREVVVWYLSNPEGLQEWATTKKESFGIKSAPFKPSRKRDGKNVVKPSYVT